MINRHNKSYKFFKVAVNKIAQVTFRKWLQKERFISKNKKEFVARVKDSIKYMDSISQADDQNTKSMFDLVFTLSVLVRQDTALTILLTNVACYHKMSEEELMLMFAEDCLATLYL